MKFIAGKEKLLAGLNTVSKATGKNVIPILENILFDIKGNVLTLTGSNLEVFISQDIEIQSELTKKIAVPHSGLMSLLNSLPDMPLEFSIEEVETVVNKKPVISIIVHIKAGKGKYNLPAEPGEDFPEVKDEFGGLEFSIKSDELSAVLQKTVWSCSTDELRPNITGIYFEVLSNKIICTSTDTNVLSTFNIPFNGNIEKTFIVSGRALKTLQSSSFNEAVYIKFSESNISIKVNESVLFIVRLIDEKYPDYKSIMPESQPFKLTADKKEMLAALKRIGAFSNNETHLAKLEIIGGKATISANDVVKGGALEEINVHYKGNDIAIGFSLNYFNNALKRVDGEDFVLSLNTPNRCMILKDADDTSEYGNLFLVMPMILPEASE